MPESETVDEPDKLPIDIARTVEHGAVCQSGEYN